MLTKTVLTIGALMAVAWPVAAQRQAAATTNEPQVEVVHTLGCVEYRSEPMGWWLTRASEPTVTTVGVFNEDEVKEANSTALGSGEFHLVGVAEFLDADAQLAWGDRSRFTTADQANATHDLQDGRKVVVKGLLIKTDSEARINLLSVVGLSEVCR